MCINYYRELKGKVLFHTKYNKYFKEKLKVFTAEDFIGELTYKIYFKNNH